jgi:exonuclease VII small subunit
MAVSGRRTKLSPFARSLVQKTLNESVSLDESVNTYDESVTLDESLKKTLDENLKRLWMKV